jgi:DNA replication protein DnaC
MGVTSRAMDIRMRNVCPGSNTANVRVHQTIQEQPITRFDRDERVHLKPLATQPYGSLLRIPVSEPKTRKVLARVEVEQPSSFGLLSTRGKCIMKTAPPSRRERIQAQLVDLRMPGGLESLDSVLSAADSGLHAGEAIETLLGAQITLRNNRRVQAAMRSSRLPAVKTLAGFDFSFHPSIKREQIESLHKLRFVERKENVILLGPPGVGKTHLAISRTGAMLFFQLMSRRYERAATILRSNKSFEEWGEVFGDDIMATALIDRLVPHCHIINIRGNSYRLRQHGDLWHSRQPVEPEKGEERSKRRNPRQK